MKEEWTIKKILFNWLTEHGYDGLCNGDYECGCVLDDFMPCGSDLDINYCEPGYKTHCDCGEHDWHVTVGKDEPSFTSQIPKPQASPSSISENANDSSKN